MRHITPYLNFLRDTATFYYNSSSRDITILEIGVGRACSTRAFLEGLEKREVKNIGSGHLYSIDNELCGERVKGALAKRWTFIYEDSKTVWWDKPIDILFIDGDHSYEGCKSDYDKYVPFVKDGGLVYMHDILVGRYGVKDVWKDIPYPKVGVPLSGSGFGIFNKK